MATSTADLLFDSEVIEHPHSYYAQLRESDPVHLIEGTDAYLVTRLDLIQEVIANPKTYSSQTGEFLFLGPDGVPGLRSPGLGDDSEAATAGGVLATADPPDHGRQRKVLTPLLSAGAIAAREEEFRALVDGALDRLLPSGRLEWMGDVAEPLPMVMVTRLLGISDDRAPELKRQGYAAVEQISGFVPDDRRESLLQQMQEMGPVIEAYTVARSSAEPDVSNVIGICARAVADGDLDDMEAFGTFGILLAAGGESTTSLLGTGVRILAERPDLQERLRADPSLIPAFVEEACRIDPPFRGHYRRVVEDTTLGGVALPAGSRLVLVWPAANRDPGTHDRPEEIDIDRPNPRQHVGFGWGIHLCIGAPLARLEARVTFERLLARTKSFAVDTSAEELRHHKSLMIRRLVTLPLVVEVGP